MTDSTRTIRVENLTRVEGEGGLTVRLRDGQVDGVELQIFEPPRLFEALLRGRALEEAPDITARICGICPVAYQMSAVHALEAALGIAISPEIRQLRRLLYCGEWIESHALHIHLLHAPDFFECASGIELAQRFPEEIRRGLRMKKHGNQILAILGGRPIHPINVTVGGFYRAPRVDQLSPLLPDLQWGLEAAIATARWLAEFAFPDVHHHYEFVALRHLQEYAMNEGQIVSSEGLAIDATDYEQHFIEQQVPHSTALHSIRVGSDRPYCVGPLARMALNYDQLRPIAKDLANEVGFSQPCHNPYRSILARAIEIVQSFDEAIDIVKGYVVPRPSCMEYAPRLSEGCAVTEAPRGLLYHRYRIDEQGRLTFAKIVPPTSQNQWQMEQDLIALLPPLLNCDDQAIAAQCEKAVRNYDPCISCSTHFLRVKIDRQTAE